MGEGLPVEQVDGVRPEAWVAAWAPAGQEPDAAAAHRTKRSAAE